MPIPLRTESSGVPAPATDRPEALPGLVPSLLPIVLPVLLISANTVVSSLAAADRAAVPWIATGAAVLGNANLALLLAAAVALVVYARQRRPTAEQMRLAVESALMSGGVIILITAAGGAFGAMLQEARIGPEIQALFGSGANGMMHLFLAFGVASLMKIAQGSSTVAMITTSAMLAGMMSGAATLPFHIVYVATAIGAGSLVGSWMNDSGFWVVSRMGGLTEVEALKSWTAVLVVVGVTSMLVTLALAVMLPLK